MVGTRKRTKRLPVVHAALLLVVLSPGAVDASETSGAWPAENAPRAAIGDAFDAYDRGDLAAASRVFRALALAGDSQAQYELAQLYDYGEGVTQNHQVAALWYRRAADHGHVDAQLQLGLMYQTGEGRPRDPVRARFWYRQAALRGDDEAQLLLGVLHAEGLGVRRDPTRALAWFRVSAHHGNDNAAQRAMVIAAEMTVVEVATAERLARSLEAQVLAGPPNPVDLLAARLERR